MATEIFEVVTSFVGAQQYAAIVQHEKIVDPISGDWDTAAQIVEDMISGGVAPFLLTRLSELIAEDTFISSLRCRRVFPAGGNTAVQVFTAAAFPGGAAGPVHATQVAACIIFPSEAANGLHGRNFIPFVSESDLDENRFTDDFKTRVVAYATRLAAGGSITSGDYTPVIYNRTLHTSFDLVNAYLSPKPGTQRRRLTPL